MGDKVKVRPLDAETQETLMKLFSGNPHGYARFGEGGCLMPSCYADNADILKTTPVRADDVWVVTYPRSACLGVPLLGKRLPSFLPFVPIENMLPPLALNASNSYRDYYGYLGTTWMQELVWLLMNNLDYETALKIPLMARYYFIELTSVFPVEDSNADVAEGKMQEELLKVPPSLQQISEAPAPRFIKTHLPFSLLPDNLLDTTKVVYVARDPRDVAVSFYHHCRLFKADYVGDFKTFWNLFINDLVYWSPFFPHLKEAWAHRDHPNMLFMFYEELQQDLPASIKRIAKFLGKEVSSEQIQRLSEHLNIKNFKNNESVNPSWVRKMGHPDEEGMVRKGKSGGWYEYFDEEMAAQAQRWLRTQLSDTDLRFPDTGSKVANLVSMFNK